MRGSNDGEWLARRLEALGHEVIVAGPNFAPMYATRSRKVKTDGRDARALAEACARSVPTAPAIVSPIPAMRPNRGLTDLARSASLAHRQP